MMDDFSFEMEYAMLTDDRDRADAALMARFPIIRPVDLALFGGWEEEAAMLVATLGHPGNSDQWGNRIA